MRVFADNAAGFYLGAAIGASHVRSSQEILGDTGYNADFDERHSAWKVTAGIRPALPLGVELEYIDFGNPSAGSAIGEFGGISRADAKALALFGVGYAPLPVPFLDLYGKLGVARLRMTMTEVPPTPICPAGQSGCGTCPVGATSCAPTPFNISSSSTNVAYGAGVRGKFGSLAIRAEYERIAASGGNPDLFSLGITWSF
jgi:hypothetical protein